MEILNITIVTAAKRRAQGNVLKIAVPTPYSRHSHIPPLSSSGIPSQVGNRISPIPPRWPESCGGVGGPPQELSLSLWSGYARPLTWQSLPSVSVDCGCYSIAMVQPFQCLWGTYEARKIKPLRPHMNPSLAVQRSRDTYTKLVIFSSDEDEVSVHIPCV